MKYVLAIFFSIILGKIIAQPFNNEWIDYSKTYYRFYVGATGLHRVNQSTLSAAGLGNTPVEQIQLWKNGQQIAIYTSQATGILPSNGFIEFWAEKNDGSLDKALYRYQQYQVNDQISLHSEFATYFITVSNSNNLRITNQANNVATNTLPVETSFLHTQRVNFTDQISRGEANTFYGEYIYSSSFDKGEMFASRDIQISSPLDVSFTNLFPTTTGNARLEAAFAGTSILGVNRSVQVAVNGTDYINNPLTQFNYGVFNNNNIPNNLLAGNTTIRIKNTTSSTEDRMVCSYVALQYNRLFNFGNAANFTFNLPANAQGNYLEISNFSQGAAAPVLYDITNNQRYTANIDVAGIFRFRLNGSNTSRKLVLVSVDANNIYSVANLTQRNFINYALVNNQGNFLIITNNLLSGSSNATEQYRAYRSSVSGGGYDAKLYDIEQLQDQFAFGIKKHPFSIRNFLLMARANYSRLIQAVFLLGKGITYDEYRRNETNADVDKLNLVPTFGWPASDNLLVSNTLLNATPALPIGRIAAITPTEVLDYLDKIKEYDTKQSNVLQTIANKAWMKTSLHVVGANSDGLDALLTNYENGYINIIKDTLFGGNTFSFNKTASGPITPSTNAQMEQLFASGIAVLNYFGHSSSTSLDYNISDPSQFSNQGKYPVFVVNGCNAGNFFSFDVGRFVTPSSLAEKFVLAKNRGSIAFIASSHFGVTSFLDALNRGLYNSFVNTSYNKILAINVKDAIAYSLLFGGDTLGYRLHAEENTLHGDPAIKINSFAKPDFVVEDAQVLINPAVVSVAENSFNVKAFIYNIGKATGDSVQVIIKRQYPDGSTTDLFNKKIKSVRYVDSVSVTVPIVASRDKGENKILVSVDNIGAYDELSELNNNTTKSVFIFEDELTPIYPIQHQIVNNPSVKFSASTANPIAASRQYLFEIDTTALFNSPLKKSSAQVSIGGVLSFTPGISYTDSTVYYWRVAPAPTNGPTRWNTASFVYMAGTNTGLSQYHFYQHTQSATNRIFIDSSSRQWKFKNKENFLQIVHSVFGTSGQEPSDFQVVLNGRIITQSACVGKSIIFNVFDPITLKPLINQPVPSTIASGNAGGFMGSGLPCQYIGTNTNFEFAYWDTTGRRRIRDFMDWIPTGAIVTTRLILDQPFNSTPWAAIWKADDAVYGAGNTMYQRLLNAGLTDIDSFYKPRTFVFTYKKNDISYSAQAKFSTGLYDKITLNKDVVSPDSIGTITSPLFGKAKAWKRLIWSGNSQEFPTTDRPTIDVIGVTNAGAEQLLQTYTLSQQNVDISNLVNATQYPYIRLRMNNRDSINFTPYQLKNWSVLYDPVPEGALAGNITFSFKDTLQLGEPLNAVISFKNVSETTFSDSIAVRVTVTDKANNATVINLPKLKKIIAQDTATIRYQLSTNNYSGNNTFNIVVNPAEQQPEQTLVNNFLFKNFYVSPDNVQPLLDVTFDGIHILNNDIVASKPKIIAKLKDESNFLLLDDTSLVTVQLRYPNNTIRRFAFGTDTLKFNAATSSTSNTASIEFNPNLLQDGDYELYVRGKDKSNNPAGLVEYRVSFKVYGKPMISNVFNYPNPFTTSTAFVFTLTGNSVPQNIRIQILTITGKIVKEITKDELGPLHVGRNITEYKWDGTDTYGQKLGNGVYLYRIITNQNGNSLEKFPTYDAYGSEVDTDKYFKAGYGKMYLMR